MWHKIPSHPHIPVSPRAKTLQQVALVPNTSYLIATRIIPYQYIPNSPPTPCSFGQCESHSAVINGPSQHPNPSAATPYDPTTHPDYSHPTPSYARVYLCMSLYYEANVLIYIATLSQATLIILAEVSVHDTVLNRMHVA